ncbi:MAG: phage holin family protein [Mameliella sp.]|nr:phage holin family protein [Phaeodactylibacter sp.]NRA50223.1 phage holin family protein [Phaeodactylibacter sp.]
MDLLLLDIHGPVYWAMKFALNALALMAGAHFLDGVKIDDFVRAMIVAILLAVLNATLGNVLDFITTPLRFLTLGLFSFVVDAGLLLVAAYFLKGFHIDNFKSAFFLAILLAIFNTVLYGVFL